MTQDQLDEFFAKARDEMAVQADRDLVRRRIEIALGNKGYVRDEMRAMTDEDLARLADETGARGEQLAQELREAVADLHGGKR